MSATDPQGTQTTSTSGALGRARRAVVVLLALALAFAAHGQYREWRDNRDHLLGLLGRTTSEGVVPEGTTPEAEDTDAQDSVEQRIRREATPHHAQLAAVRSLVFQALDPNTPSGAPRSGSEDASAIRLVRLREAQSLAREALQAQPNSWQASMLLGASTYLVWAQQRDARLFTEADTWQRPLLTALDTAPAQDEPRRLLATIYLELWQSLSPDRRDVARRLLAETFEREPDSHLIPVWLATARDVEEAFALVPNQPAAWRTIERGYAERKQWELFLRARERRLTSLEQDIERRIDEGELRLTLGDDFHSRTRFLRALGDAPADGRFLPLVERAIRLFPPGLQTAGTGRSLDDWLDWALELGAIGQRPMDPSVLDRLAAVLERRDAPVEALAALLGDDLARAELVERLDLDHRSDAWRTYLVAKSEHLLARGEISEADTTIGQVGAQAREGARYWLTRLAIARAKSDDAVVDVASERLAALRARRYAPHSWRAQGRGHRLLVLPPGPAEELEIGIVDAPPHGAVVEIRLDGTTVANAVVRPGHAIRVEVPLTGDRLHLLEMKPIAGGTVQPGAVRVIDRASI